jgi:hypothetical protein
MSINSYGSREKTKEDIYRAWCVLYLGILCDIIQASDMQAELSRLCELSKADAKRDQLVAPNAGSLAHQRLTVFTQGWW